MDCSSGYHLKTEPIISEVLTVFNGEIIKTRTVVTFVENKYPNESDNESVQEITRNIQEMSFENKSVSRDNLHSRSPTSLSP